MTKEDEAVEYASAPPALGFPSSPQPFQLLKSPSFSVVFRDTLDQMKLT